MKKFFETIKDFIYDSVDYLIIITIIAIVVVVIGWRINILFEEKPIDQPQASIEDREEDNNNVDKEKDPEVEGSADLENPDSDTSNDENISPSQGTGKIVKVTIPPGTLPSKIGEILTDNGLVSSREEFISKSQEMNLDTKLKSGNFDIEVGTSLENIIKIIAK